MSRWAVAALALVLVGCSRSASDDRLRTWLDEYRPRGRRAQEAEHRLGDDELDALGARQRLRRRGQLQLGQHHRDGSHPSRHLESQLHDDVNAQLDYRGVPIVELLDASGAHEVRRPGGSELTIIAADGSHTMPLADVRRFPVMLARSRRTAYLSARRRAARCSRSSRTPAIRRARRSTRRAARTTSPR